MKVNRHYAGALPWPGTGVDNGLRPDQVGREGTDMFILEDGCPRGSERRQLLSGP